MLFFRKKPPTKIQLAVIDALECICGFEPHRFGKPDAAGRIRIRSGHDVDYFLATDGTLSN